MDGYPWTFSNRRRLWWYNNITRPWRNLMWATGLDPLARAFRAAFPNYPTGYPKEGRITRETLEWADKVFREYESR